VADQGDLYGLLGLPRDVSPDRLRHQYEQRMAEAVRSHDHVRALALSKAFDALPLAARRSIYSGTGQPAPRPGHQREFEVRPMAAGVRQPRVRKRFIVALILVIAGPLVVGAIVKLRREASNGTPPAPPAVAPAPIVPVTVTRSVGVPILMAQVPMDAPTQANGRVLVGCPSPDGRSITYSYGYRGQYVSCGPGVAPVFPR
jgi:hypothetical protein